MHMWWWTTREIRRIGHGGHVLLVLHGSFECFLVCHNVIKPYQSLHTEGGRLRHCGFEVVKGGKSALEDGELVLEKILGSFNPTDMLIKTVPIEKLKLCATSVGLLLLAWEVACRCKWRDDVWLVSKWEIFECGAESNKKCPSWTESQHWGASLWATRHQKSKFPLQGKSSRPWSQEDRAKSHNSFRESTIFSFFWLGFLCRYKRKFFWWSASGTKF